MTPSYPAFCWLLDKGYRWFLNVSRVKPSWMRGQTLIFAADSRAAVVSCQASSVARVCFPGIETFSESSAYRVEKWLMQLCETVASSVLVGAIVGLQAVFILTRSSFKIWNLVKRYLQLFKTVFTYFGVRWPATRLHSHVFFVENRESDRKTPAVILNSFHLFKCPLVSNSPSFLRVCH